MMPWRRLLKLSWLVLAGSLLLMMAACAPRPVGPQRLAVDQEVAGRLLEAWRQRSAANISLQGIASARVETADGNFSGTQVLLAERPNLFRAESLSPFGTPLLILAANGDRLGVLLPTRNLFYTGAATAENLGRFSRLPLVPEDLVDLLLYRPPLLTDRVEAGYALPDGGWQLVLIAGERRQELFFDPAERLVRVLYAKGGRTLLEARYRAIGALVDDFPAEFAIDVPEFATRARLKFSELAINRSFQPGIFRLEPPAGAQVRELDIN